MADPEAGSDRPSEAPTSAALEAEIERQHKIIAALIRRAESSSSLQHSEYAIFETAVVLEGQVRRRTEELELALSDNERLNRDLRLVQQ